MINQYSSFLFLIFIGLILLPIYPNSGSLDFGGHVDVSIVYILILIFTGNNKSRLMYGSLILVFYFLLADTYGLIELGIKLVIFYLFIEYIERFFWKNIQNESLIILLFLTVFYSLSFIVYKIGFNIGLYEFLSFICLPFIYNFFVSLILLIIIKYTSWPKVNDQVYRF